MRSCFFEGEAFFDAYDGISETKNVVSERSTVDIEADYEEEGGDHDYHDDDEEEGTNSVDFRESIMAVYLRAIQWSAAPTQTSPSSTPVHGKRQKNC